MGLEILYSGLGCMGNFVHTLVWWLLGLWSGLRDYLLLHLWFLAVCNGRQVLAALLLYMVVIIVIVIISVTIVTIVIIVTKTVVG